MANYNAITNNDLYTLVQATSANFANLTAKMSYEEFAAAVKGGQTGEQIQTIKNEFLQTAMMFWLNEVIAPDARDYFEDQDFGVKYYSDFAGAMQNMYVTVSNPINPKFKNPKNGAGADPFQVQKPVVAEVFYTFNFDYQNVVTVGDVQLKTAFANESGLSRLIAGVMKALASKFTEQKMSLKAEALNAAINDTNKPLKEAQKMTVSLSDEPTREELVDFVNGVNNIVDAMTIKATSGFNRVGWHDVQDKNRLRILYRPSLKNAIKTGVLESAFNKEELNMDIKPVLVPDFGGLIPSSDGTLENRLNIIYDAEGRVIGYGAGEEVEYTAETVKWYDPNADVVAVICDYATIFELDQNPYSVYGIYNPANMLTTYWANKPTGSIHYDPYRNLVVIRKEQA